MALAEAILGAVTAISQTVTTFVGAGAQKYAISKSSELEGVSVSRAKALAAYNGISAVQKLIVLFLVVLIVIVLIYKYYK